MMKKWLFLVMLVATACSPKNHKVTFDIDLMSTSGNDSLIIECYEAQALLDYIKDQGASMMSGKKPTVEQPPKLGRYDSKGRPAQNKFNFMLELPEKEITCGIPPMSFITFRTGDKAGQVFKPNADTTVKVSYNMHTKDLYKADSTGAAITIIK